MALADYMHKKSPELQKMKILFLRESAGVYQFGNRRVHIEIQKGNNLKVRIGGGYVHIDEFIEKYQDQEMQRIQRREVISRFKNKIQM